MGRHRGDDCEIENAKNVDSSTDEGGEDHGLGGFAEHISGKLLPRDFANELLCRVDIGSSDGLVRDSESLTCTA